MSSSDDFNDQQLRKHFQRAFENFERQPETEAEKRLWQRLPKRSGVYQRTGILSVVILLLLVTSLYLESYQPKVDQTRVKAYRPKSTESFKSIQSGESKRYNNLEPTQRQPLADAGQLPDPTLAPPSINTSDRLHQQKMGWSDSKQVEIGSAWRLQEKRHALGQENIKITENQRVNFEGTPARFASIQLAAQETDTVAGEAGSWLPLEPHDIWSPSKWQASVHRTISLPTATSSLAPSTGQKQPMRWFARVAPLSTYQWMTVVAKPESYVQQVNAPAAFSAATWGYQLSGGIEWNQFEFHLSAGLIRRWAHYQIATSTFQIKPLGANQYEVIRVAQSVAENESLLLLGAGISKKYRLGGTESPYFARLGGTTSYVPDTRQALVWANASIGLSLPLKSYQLQFGPVVEYGLSRLWSSERQLIIHPYLVGASLTIQPNKSNLER